MSPSQRNDPVRGYNFIIKFLENGSGGKITDPQTAVDNIAMGGFSECSGLETTLDVEEYEEGGLNGTTLKFPTRVKWSNIRLRHGIVRSNALWEWYYSFVEGRGRRRDGLIILQNDQHVPVRTWQFKRGLPVKWTGPSLNATSNEVVIEELEIAHEGINVKPPSGQISVGDVVGAAEDVVDAVGSAF